MSMQGQGSYQTHQFTAPEDAFPETQGHFQEEEVQSPMVEPLYAGMEGDVEMDTSVNHATDGPYEVPFDRPQNYVDRPGGPEVFSTG